MNVLEKLPYDKRFLIADNYTYDNFYQRIYLEKTYFKEKDSNQYFLKLYVIMPNGNMECQGYIYFYIDFPVLSSSFIGMYIKPEYRNQGLASLLISHWIKLCLDNGIYNLQTNKRQRKPALLYSLKNFAFELENPEDYEISPFTISVCEGNFDALKYLYFKNAKQREDFLHGTIMQQGNYYVIDELNGNFQVLDQILLSTPYYLQDDNEAYTRSLRCIEKKK